MANFYQADIGFNRRTILKAKEHGCSLTLLGQNDICRSAPVHNALGISLEQAMPLRHIRDGFPKILVITDGHVYRIQGALRHLVKNTTRPVTVLKTIDSNVHLFRDALIEL
jgi:hypothetical protein